jgi:hypothetical protein
MNQRIFTKNITNPRITRTPKLSPLYSPIWEGDQREKNHAGFMYTSPTKSQRGRSQNHLKKIAKKRHRKSPKRKTGKNSNKL